MLSYRKPKQRSNRKRKKQLGADRFRFMTWPGFELIEPHVTRVWGKTLTLHTGGLAHAPTVYRAMLTGEPYPVRAMITSSAPI